MRPFRTTIPMSEALARVLEAAVPTDRTEHVPLDQSHGRVLADAVVAPADVPPFDRAAMDGYAVIANDTAGASRDAPRTLRRVEVLYAGQVPSRTLAPGECAEIATGAPIPEGADAVVMVEQTENLDGQVRVFSPVSPRQNVGRRGSDMTAGATVLEPGSFLNPSRVGALAAAGVSAVRVYARPVVAILSTGSELVEAGRSLAPGQIYDVNRHTLAAVVTLHGGQPLSLPSAPDTIEELTRVVRDLPDADLVVFSGGSSVGDRDLVLDVLRAAGEVLFHGIAVKPGKPTALGRIGARPVLGMPGNPTSCLSNAYLLLAPMLRRIARLPAHRPQTIRARLARRIVSTTDRHQFYTVRLEDGAAVPAFKGSGDITSMAHADGYIEIPAGTPAVEAGDEVEVTCF
jgi:molybdopterin molybdotransferase